jgi:hypothetical protein
MLPERVGNIANSVSYCFYQVFSNFIGRNLRTFQRRPVWTPDILLGDRKIYK